MPKATYGRHFMALCKMNMKNVSIESERRSDEAHFERGCARMTWAVQQKTFDMLVAMRSDTRCATTLLQSTVMGVL